MAGTGGEGARPLTLEAAEFLVSDAGIEAGRALRGRSIERRTIEDLRRAHGADVAAALVDQERGRVSLARRHADADEIHCTALGAQQASGGVAAAHRARRFAELGATRVVEIGCGLGLDSRELARTMELLAVDPDAARLCLARANVRRFAGEAKVSFLEADHRAVDLSGAFVYSDPDRRPSGKRVHDPEAASPPLSDLLDDARSAAGVAVKLSPMAEPRALEARGELEFVSVGRELKETILWTGDLDRGGRRISLPEWRAELKGRPGDGGAEPAAVVEEGCWLWTGDLDRGGRRISLPEWRAELKGRPGDGGAEPAAVVEEGCWLWDPDPALTRSGLVGLAMERGGGQPLVDGAVYGVAERACPDPWFKSERIIAVIGPGPKEVRRELRSRGIGRIRASRRDFALSPEDFVRRLKLDGAGELGRIHLTRTPAGPRVLLTDAFVAQNPDPAETRGHGPGSPT